MTADTLERLRFIRRAKVAGFTLREIAELVRLDRTHERSRVRELASGKLEALARQIEDLQQTHAALRHLVHLCESENPDEDCPIIESLGGEMTSP
jgi:MerR family mercuric resistance operon transcriptional regulator